MRIIGNTLLAAFPNRIVNLHPALLPSFPGRTGIQDAYDYGVKVTGVTVHYVDAGIDSGRSSPKNRCASNPANQLKNLKRGSMLWSMNYCPKQLPPYSNKKERIA